MWQIDNRTPFAVERTWVRDRDGTEIWTVAVKASFRFSADGGVTVDAVQPPVTQAPVHHGAPGQSSVRYENDLQRTKVSTDVVLVGSAHAPGGRALRRLDVGFRVGPVVKTLRIHGDRRWQRGRIGEAEPFASMPLTYERAFGGRDPSASPAAWDERNPVGRGFVTSASGADGVALPNIECADQPTCAWNDRPTPVGFGPIPCHWPQRRRWAGTYDDRWQRERMPLLPRDFDDRFFQFAPVDQQATGFLRGGEPVTLHHLTPGGGDVGFVLPRPFLGFDTSFYSGPAVVHVPPKLHTVILEPDLWRVSMVWHTALPCHSRVLKLERTRVTLKQDLRVGALATLVAGSAL